MLGAIASAAIPVMGQVAGSVMDFIGGSNMNKANAKQAQMNRDFQERMSSTSYQRAVADLKAAGLNPGLAYQQGGASSPTGSTAQMQNTLGAFKGTAKGAAETFNEVATAKANRAAIEAQTAKTQAEAGQIRLESAARLAAIESEIKLRSSTARRTDELLEGEKQELGTRSRAQRAHGDVEFAESRYRHDAYALRLGQLRAMIDQALAHARESNSRSVILGLQEPELRNRANRQDDWFKKYVSPYLSDAKGAGDILSGIAGGAIGGALTRGAFRRRGKSAWQDHIFFNQER